jgi:hypothetical protein
MSKLCPGVYSLSVRDMVTKTPSHPANWEAELPLQARFNNTMNNLAACANSVDAEETAVRLRDPRFFQERMDMLTDLLCMPDEGSTLELIR